MQSGGRRRSRASPVAAKGPKPDPGRKQLQNPQTPKSKGKEEGLVVRSTYIKTRAAKAKAKAEEEEAAKAKAEAEKAIEEERKVQEKEEEGADEEEMGDESGGLSANNKGTGEDEGNTPPFPDEVYEMNL